MEQPKQRQVVVGQTAKHRGADVEIVSIAPDGENVKVSYPYAHKNAAWVKVEDLHFPEPLLTSPNISPDIEELYPVGTVLTNGAKESVKVVDRFKQDVKLQLGTLVGGALATDFQPSEDEPFTMTESDLTEWLGKTLPSTATDTLPLELPLYTWLPGQRARLLQDLPDDRWPLSADDEGTVVLSGGELGFYSDRYTATAKVRSLKGETVRVLNYCEAIMADSLTPETADVPEVATDETERDSPIEIELKALKGENAQLSRSLKSAHEDLKTVHNEADTAVAAAKELAATLSEAEKRIQQLEADKARLELKNAQQSEMLRDAVPQAISPNGQKHLKTLMTPGGSNGFNNAVIPHGYEIVSVTTEVYDGKLTRLIHLIGCGDSPAPHEEHTHKVTVEFEQAQNSFEDLLRGDVPAEAVIEFANAEVLAAARQAAEARLKDYVQTEMPLLEEVK